MSKINYSDLLKTRIHSSFQGEFDCVGKILDTSALGSIFTFTSFGDDASKNLQSFFKKLMVGKTEEELKLELKKVKVIKIYNTNMDSVFVDILSSWFSYSDLSLLEIRNCNVMGKCFFSNLNAKEIRMGDSFIETFHSFNLSKSDLYFIRCDILSVGNSHVFCEKLDLFKSKIDFYSLFLMSNFPNLDDFRVESEVSYDGYSNESENFGNSFLYLPYSSPNITKLRISGVVDDLDFLVRLKKLSRVSVVSTYEDMSGEALRINNQEKLKELERKNKTQVEIRKILYGVSDSLDEIKYITRSEMDRIVNLNDFYRTLSFTNQEMEALKHEFEFSGSYLEFVLQQNWKELKGYYKNEYNKLHYFSIDDSLFSFYPLVYQYGSIFYDEGKKKIVIPKKIMFYMDGTPIILKHSRKPIMTIEDAQRFMDDHPSGLKKLDDVVMYIDALKQVALERNRDVFVYQFKDCVQEIYSLNLVPIYRSVLDRVDSDKNVILKLHKIDEAWSYIYHIRNIYKKNRELLAEIINRKFSSFTSDELKVIDCLFPSKNTFELIIIEDFSSDIITSIDSKCDFKFIKLYQSLMKFVQIERDVFTKYKSYLLTEKDLSEIGKMKVKSKTPCYDAFRN